MWAPKEGGARGKNYIGACTYVRRSGKFRNGALGQRKEGVFGIRAREGRKNKLPPTFSGRAEISPNLHLCPDDNSRRARNAAPDDAWNENWARWKLKTKEASCIAAVSGNFKHPIESVVVASSSSERDEHSLPKMPENIQCTEEIQEHIFLPSLALKTRIMLRKKNQQRYVLRRQSESWQQPTEVHSSEERHGQSVSQPVSWRVPTHFI